MPSKHAILSPSASKRWMTCTPSARLEAEVPNRDTAYTREGTIAHAMAEFLLNNLKSNGNITVDHDLIATLRTSTLREYLPDDLLALFTQTEELGADPWEMLETVYTGYVVPVYEDFLTVQNEDPAAVLLVEAELKLTEYIPEGFGSSDAVIIGGGSLNVYDLKYGKGVKVDAKHNTQMMCYALGAYCGPAELFDTAHVTMTICQPRLNHISTWTISERTLLKWAAEELRPAAARAFAGEGPQVPGEHCKFCRVAAQCRALRDQVLSTDWAEAACEGRDAKTAVPLMTMEEVAAALGQAPVIRTWLDSIEAFALDKALAGETVPGYKLAEGRSVRKIKDPAAALAKLEGFGLSPDDYLKPRELKTIGDLEKLLKKANFNKLLGDLVEKPKGKPTLVRDSDTTHAAYVPDAAKEFENVNI